MDGAGEKLFGGMQDYLHILANCRIFEHIDDPTRGPKPAI